MTCRQLLLEVVLEVLGVALKLLKVVLELLLKGWLRIKGEAEEETRKKNRF